VKGTSPQEDADRFSDFDQKNEKENLDRFHRSLQILLETLGRVSIRTTPASRFLVAEPAPGQPLLPLGVIGCGLQRLTGMLLGIEGSAGGILLIDEFENGFHHSALPKIWEAIFESAQKAHVQVFATTHSKECLAAAIRAIHSDHLNFFRLQKIQGQIKTIAYEPEVALAAVDEDVEMR
jgi:hypothetical protein